MEFLYKKFGNLFRETPEFSLNLGRLYTLYYCCHFVVFCPRPKENCRLQGFWRTCILVGFRLTLCTIVNGRSKFFVRRYWFCFDALNPYTTNSIWLRHIEKRLNSLKKHMGELACICMRRWSTQPYSILPPPHLLSLSLYIYIYI